MSAAPQSTALSAAFDDYPHTLALKRGEIRSDRVTFQFSEIKPANRFFKPMIRELKFDVSEMAIGSYVQAKAHGKPLVLLPATLMGRFQHGTLLCTVARALNPADLPGKRIGVRSYSQTTAVWVRGILANEYGIDPDRLRWVTFEDGHVGEFREPAGVERAPTGSNLLQMLRQGDLDAAIYGADLPDDPTLTSVIADPDRAAQRWYDRHGVVPINHMVVVTQSLAQSRPDLVVEIYRLLARAKQAAGLPKAGRIDFLPFGFEASRPALDTIVDYALQQKLISQKIETAALFDATTRALET
jgi:4,5-dihydroxyphthalate decarboxylase